MSKKIVILLVSTLLLFQSIPIHCYGYADDYGTENDDDSSNQSEDYSNSANRTNELNYSSEIIDKAFSNQNHELNGTYDGNGYGPEPSNLHTNYQNWKIAVSDAEKLYNMRNPTDESKFQDLKVEGSGAKEYEEVNDTIADEHNQKLSSWIVTSTNEKIITDKNKQKFDNFSDEHSQQEFDDYNVYYQSTTEFDDYNVYYESTTEVESKFSPKFINISILLIIIVVAVFISLNIWILAKKC